MEPTREEKTEILYLKRASDIINRYVRESGQPVENIEALIHWLSTTLQPTIVKNTWRYYKSAIAYYLQSQGLSLNSVAAIKKMENHNCKLESSETSALKQKKMSYNDIELIASKMNAGKNKWDGLIISWLEAGVVTGLRPSEWATAHLRGNYLIVQNAKNTNGRSFGVERVLDLSNLDENDYEAIEKFMRKLHYALWSNHVSFHCIYEACRMRLRWATSKLWPPKKKHPTLYSCRHQFSADMKNTLSKKEIAALMGHAVDDTATEHYGKKQSGTYKENHILPLPDQVDLIEEKETRADKKEKKEKKS